MWLRFRRTSITLVRVIFFVRTLEVRNNFVFETVVISKLFRNVYPLNLQNRMEETLRIGKEPLNFEEVRDSLEIILYQPRIWWITFYVEMKWHNVFSILLYLHECKCIVDEVKTRALRIPSETSEIYWVINSLCSMFPMKKQTKKSTKFERKMARRRKKDDLTKVEVC